MNSIKTLPPMERPREKLQLHGPRSLSDEELLAILLGSGTPQVPLEKLCRNLLSVNDLAALAQMDIETLCQFKGIGLSKATIILAAAEFSNRLQPKGGLLQDTQAYRSCLRGLLINSAQPQYLLLLLSAGHELLAFADTGSTPPDISRLTALALDAKAATIVLGYNGWPADGLKVAEYTGQLMAACDALGLRCAGVLNVSH